MFGSTVTRIDFNRIDYVKVILIKIDFKLKWFMLWYIHAKVNLTKNLNVKINSRIRSYDFYLQIESIILLKNKTNQNQFYTSKINSECSKIKTKHTLNLLWIRYIENWYNQKIISNYLKCNFFYIIYLNFFLILFI
jgi:hypothetical protein